MNVLTVTIAPRESMSRRALVAFSGRRQAAQISFHSAELLWEVLRPKRWNLLEAMTGKGPMTVRAVAAKDVTPEVSRLQSTVRAMHRVESSLLLRN